MDGLEAQAADPVVTEPEGEAQPAPSTVPVQETPEFQQAVKGFQSDYTRKTQELAQGRNELQAERASFAQERQQYLETINRPQGDIPNDAALSQRLPAHLRDTLNPEAVQVLDLVGQQTSDMVNPVRESMAEMQATIDQQTKDLQSMKTQTWASQKQREIPEVQAKYGADVVAQHEGAIAQMLQANPHLSVEQAFTFAAPDAYREHIRAEEAAKAQEQIKLQYGGGLEGMTGAPGASPTPTYTEGESMEASAQRTMGLPAYNQAIIDAAMSQ